MNHINVKLNQILYVQLGKLPRGLVLFWKIFEMKY